MTFTRPGLLAAAVLGVVALALLLRITARRRAEETLAYSNLAFMESATAVRVPWAALLAGAWIAAALCMGVALAGPHVVAPVRVSDGAVALCIDTSGSMASTDIAPSRAAAALSAARAFIDGVPDGTRIVLVSFASGAAVILPPTDDKEAARDALDRIPAPNGGTAIGDALTLAARSLPRVPHRAIVLMTDGVNNAGSDPLAAAAAIGNAGIAIETVGIGTRGSGLLIPGTNQEADIDEDALRAMAASGHGAYARAADADALRARLAQLAQTATTERRRVDASLPLALAGGALMLATSAVAFVLGRFP